MGDNIYVPVLKDTDKFTYILSTYNYNMGQHELIAQASDKNLLKAYVGRELQWETWSDNEGVNNETEVIKQGNFVITKVLSLD